MFNFFKQKCTEDCIDKYKIGVSGLSLGLHSFPPFYPISSQLASSGDISLLDFSVSMLSVSSEPLSLAAVKITNVFSDKTVLFCLSKKPCI